MISLCAIERADDIRRIASPLPTAIDPLRHCAAQRHIASESQKCAREARVEFGELLYTIWAFAIGVFERVKQWQKCLLTVIGWSETVLRRGSQRLQRFVN